MKTRAELTPHPHDRFFKQAMADKRVAKDFFEAHLPENILALIDLNHLESQAGSFVNDFRRESITDVLYKTKIAEQSGYIYLIVDHQSTPDKLMPFRILKYTCNIIDQHLRETKEKSLPMILPLVVYHGKKSWHYSTNINDLVNFDKEVVDNYFLKPFLLVDLTQIDDEILKQRAWSGAMTLSLKHIFKKNMDRHMSNIIEVLKIVERTGERRYSQNVVIYIAERAELADENAFIDLVQTELAPETGENIMTIAERLIMKGEIRGEIKGEMKNKLKTAERLLSENADLNYIARITELPLEKIKELQDNHC